MPKRIERTVLPQSGTVYTRMYKDQSLKAKVVSVDEASGRIKLEVNGIEYSSPSAAAKAFTGNDVNGWVFWGIDS